MAIFFNLNKTEYLVFTIIIRYTLTFLESFNNKAK